MKGLPQFLHAKTPGYLGLRFYPQSDSFNDVYQTNTLFIYLSFSLIKVIINNV